MVSCGLACHGGGGAGVSGREFRGSGWGWDRRCQDPGARGLGPGGGGALGGPYHMGGGGGSNTEHGTIYTCVASKIGLCAVALCTCGMADMTGRGKSMPMQDAQDQGTKQV